MNLENVMQEIANRLETIPGLKKVYPHPAESVTPPTGIVSYPEAIQYDQTYGRGVDRISSLPVVLVVGKPHVRAAWEKAAAWSSGAGNESVKAVLESGEYTAFDELQVTSCTFDVVTIASVDYIAAMFELDIVGPGNS